LNKINSKTVRYQEGKRHTQRVSSYICMDYRRCQTMTHIYDRSFAVKLLSGNYTHFTLLFMQSNKAIT